MFILYSSNKHYPSARKVSATHVACRDSCVFGTNIFLTVTVLS
jgi:hypothetical protein